MIGIFRIQKKKLCQLTYWVQWKWPTSSPPAIQPTDYHLPVQAQRTALILFLTALNKSHQGNGRHRNRALRMHWNSQTYTGPPLPRSGIQSTHQDMCSTYLLCDKPGVATRWIWADANNYTRRQDSYFRLRRKEIVIGMSTLKEVLGLSDFRNHLSYSQKHVLLIVGT